MAKRRQSRLRHQTHDRFPQVFGAITLSRSELGSQFCLSDTKKLNHVACMQFYQLAIGARFEFHGCQYRKVAMSMAEEDDQRQESAPARAMRGCNAAYQAPTPYRILGRPAIMGTCSIEKEEGFRIRFFSAPVSQPGGCFFLHQK